MYVIYDHRWSIDSVQIKYDVWGISQEFCYFYNFLLCSKQFLYLMTRKSLERFLLINNSLAPPSLVLPFPKGKLLSVLSTSSNSFPFFPLSHVHVFENHWHLTLTVLFYLPGLSGLFGRSQASLSTGACPATLGLAPLFHSVLVIWSQKYKTNIHKLCINWTTTTTTTETPYAVSYA